MIRMTISKLSKNQIKILGSYITGSWNSANYISANSQRLEHLSTRFQNVGKLLANEYLEVTDIHPDPDFNGYWKYFIKTTEKGKEALLAATS